MTATENKEVIRQVFEAIEHRDEGRLTDLFRLDTEFHWPPSLPYGGLSDASSELTRRTGWAETWEPLQPTASERAMDARVVAANDDEVVVLWHQRGLSPEGERFDSPVLGLYQVQQGRLIRATMFYFDPVATERFLAKATS